jgi:hypothetical protein
MKARHLYRSPTKRTSLRVSRSPSSFNPSWPAPKSRPMTGRHRSGQFRWCSWGGSARFPRIERRQSGRAGSRFRFGFRLRSKSKIIGTRNGVFLDQRHTTMKQGGKGSREEDRTLDVGVKAISDHERARDVELPPEKTRKSQADCAQRGEDGDGRRTWQRWHPSWSCSAFRRQWESESDCRESKKTRKSSC